MRTSKLLNNKIALITGATGSIGKAVSLRFALEGATIIAIARNKDALFKLDDKIMKLTGQNIVIVNENITKPDILETIRNAIYERFQKIDILVSTAATTGNLSPVNHITEKDWKNVFELNLMVNLNIIKTFDKLFRSSENARLIFTTCSQGSLPTPFWGAYGASKAALEQLVKIYANEMKETSVCSNLIDPGPIKSNLRKKVFPGEDQNLLRSAEDLTDYFLELAENKNINNGKLITIK